MTGATKQKNDIAAKPQENLVEKELFMPQILTCKTVILIPFKTY